MNMVTAVGHDLQSIRERFEQADRRLLIAGTRGDSESKAAAEWERMEAAGDHHAAVMQLADLGLMLLRYAIRENREAVRDLLMDLLADDVTDIAAAVGEVVSHE